MTPPKKSHRRGSVGRLLTLTHATFQSGGRHLRLAWFHSPPAEACDWPGRDGVARVRVDTALRPKDPAVLIIAGVPRVTARDPVVQLEACAIPPHFVQPWATIDVVRDAVRGEEGIGGSVDGEAVDAGNAFIRDAGEKGLQRLVSSR